jgi:hypothetical protein
MLRRLTIPALAIITLGVAACGGGSTRTTSGANATTGTAALARSRPTRMYKVVLSGRAETRHGPSLGRGAAIIAFHGQSVVCWRFAHLHGFTDATVAAIHSGATGTAGGTVVSLSSGPRLHHQGCVSINPALTQRIWIHPNGYYVNVLSSRYPNGAVRAQL